MPIKPVDWENLGRDNNWDTEEFYKITIEEETTVAKSIPDPQPNFKIKDKPKRARCDVCGKDRVQTRCKIHPKAEGCNYCHLKKQH